MILTTVLSLTLLGQGNLPGSDKSLDLAVEKSRIIVVAELETFRFIIGSGANLLMAGGKFKTSEVLKGKLKDGEMTNLSISASGPERLPNRGEECIFLLDDYVNRLKAVKVLNKTDENLQAVKRAVGAEKKL